MSKVNIVTVSPQDPDTLSLLASSLRQKCNEVPINVIGTSEFHKLVAMMFEIMYENDGAGLAAPQIGIQWRLATIHPADNSIDPTVVINPIVKFQSNEEEEGIEACLSIPNYYGYVSRPKEVVVESLNLRGEIQTHELEGWLARLFLHEIDHLEGILYPLRMRDKEELIYQTVYAKKAQAIVEKLSGTEFSNTK